jgi:hypothetical protein
VRVVGDTREAGEEGRVLDVPAKPHSVVPFGPFTVLVKNTGIRRDSNGNYGAIKTTEGKRGAGKGYKARVLGGRRINTHTHTSITIIIITIYSRIMSFDLILFYYYFFFFFQKSNLISTLRRSALVMVMTVFSVRSLSTYTTFG